jgi:hypothetical protein
VGQRFPDVAQVTHTPDSLVEALRKPRGALWLPLGAASASQECVGCHLQLLSARPFAEVLRFLVLVRVLSAAKGRAEERLMYTRCNDQIICCRIIC